MAIFSSQVARLLAICIAILAVSTSAQGKLAVFVSIIPQKYFVQQIGKNLVDIQVMVQPGASPASYEPRPRQMAAIAKTHIYFAIGVPFENVWLSKIASSNPKMTIVQTDHGIQKFVMVGAHHHSGNADPQDTDQNYKNEHDRDPGIPDPHIWLSPPLVMIQARSILAALQKADPVHHSDYETHYKEFITGISELDAELKTIFNGKHGLQFMVFHPSWGYFADAYGLRQIPVEVEGKNPKPAQLKKLIAYAIQKNIKAIFVQPQFSTKSAEVIARAIGGQVIIADPLAEDWALNLRNVAQKISAAIR